MSDAPRQDWAAYEAAVRPHELERLRRMTPAEKFALYADMFELVTANRIGTDEWTRLDELRWQEKLRIRNKMVKAFRKLDEFRARASDKRSG
jgi:hypothetical protein